jgi:polyisoprenoid-binding protein YceI
MKLKSIWNTGILLGALSLSSAPSLKAADMLTFSAVPGAGKMIIDGTSNIHDWTVTTRIVAGVFQVDPEFLKDPAAFLKANPTGAVVKVVIPVRSLKSDYERMDEVMQEHMHMKDHSMIKYNLVELVLKKAPDKPEGPFLFSAKGALTVNGITKTNAMEINMERQGDTSLIFKGKTDVKMTEFGIEPPAPKIALGMIHTGDDVKLTFTWPTKLKE